MEEFAEFLGIQGGAHDDDFQRIGPICTSFPFRIRRRTPAFLNRLQIGDEQVRPQRPFMCFVDNDNAVFTECRIGHEFTDYHSVGHVFYASVM